MRLTLRTMLAYLDDVLDPADAEVLGKKIDESEFAATLVKRIGTVGKKVRMDAPKVDGKGVGNDANTVAEYLDSTLPQDRVGDFERICLESDRHLSEVAACHQILTLVLGKPADVPQDLRDKIYALGHPDEVAARAAKAAKGPPIPTTSNGKPAAAAPAEVPDYLRAGKHSSIWPFLGAVAAAFLIGAVILRAMGPFDSSHPVARWLGAGTPIADADPTNTTTDVPPKPPVPPVTTDPETPESTPSDAVAPVEPPPMPVEPTPSDTVEPPPPPETPVKPVPADTELPPAPMPAPPEPMPPVVVKPVAPGAAMDVGRYLSDEQVLATLNPDDGLWYLKPSRGVLSAGERLIVLPTFRPQVALPSGVQLTFAGDSSFQMEQPGESGASRMSVSDGRFLIVTVGAAGAQIDLNLTGVEGLATLVDADSELAVKVVRWLPPGSDPENVAGIPVIELFATNGRVTWQQQGQAPIDIPPGHVYLYFGADPPELQGPFYPPTWIDSGNMTLIDKDTSQVLQELLVAEPEKPLNLSLQELLTDRRVNVRALAARCLASLEIFDPILKDLNDARLASYWAGEVAVLQQAIQHGPETAAKLRVAIERSREKDAAILYRLIWGFSQEDLEKGGSLQLVKHLKHEEMDVRVLTFLNLIAITGAQEFYRPERNPTDRASAGPIRNWESRHSKGTIVYKTPPTPLENYKPLPKADAVEPAPRPAPAPPLETEGG
jgi:hypothetical protein